MEFSLKSLTPVTEPYTYKNIQYILTSMQILQNMYKQNIWVTHYISPDMQILKELQDQTMINEFWKSEPQWAHN